MAQGNEVPNKAFSLLMDFYDAETYAKKYEILTEMKSDLTDVLIDNMAVSLDVVVPEGEIESRYEALRKCLRTYQKFERKRR